LKEETLAASDNMALVTLFVEIGAENEFSGNLIPKYLTFSDQTLSRRRSLGG
jgi:hypothetical protein